MAVWEEMQAEKIKKYDCMSYVLAVNLSLAHVFFDRDLDIPYNRASISLKNRDPLRGDLLMHCAVAVDNRLLMEYTRSYISSMNYDI